MLRGIAERAQSIGATARNLRVLGPNGSKFEEK
jgi:hypothetical protein